MTDVRVARLRAYRQAHELGWMAKAGFAAAFTGLTALLAQVSLPLPWTPVPFTFQVLGVALAGVMLGGRWAMVSMGLYLAAGLAGLHVFAPSADAFNPDALWHADRWRVLVPDVVRQTGYTAGYLVGFFAAAAFVGAYMRRRQRGLDARWTRAVGFGLLVLLLGVVGSTFFLAGGGSFAGAGSGDAYDATLDYAWLFGGLFLVCAPVVGWLLSRRAAGSEALNLYLVLLGAVAIIHLCGVPVLKLTLGWSWSKAFALGSTVFLPFDVLKAGLAVLASVSFLPSGRELATEEPA
ncbi:MAG: biotin transport system substrate-specific component [Thermoplasmata archaeon]|nr:biotin transport system substrate-specific component [Thermoplasmata archaeon]